MTLNITDKVMLYYNNYARVQSLFEKNVSTVNLGVH